MRKRDRLVILVRKLSLYTFLPAILGMVLQAFRVEPNLVGAVFLVSCCTLALCVENGVTPEFAQLKAEIETITVKPKDAKPELLPHD